MTKRERIRNGIFIGAILIMAIEFGIWRGRDLQRTEDRQYYLYGKGRDQAVMMFYKESLGLTREYAASGFIDDIKCEVCKSKGGN